MSIKLFIQVFRMTLAYTWSLEPHIVNVGFLREDGGETKRQNKSRRVTVLESKASLPGVFSVATLEMRMSGQI